MYLLYNFLFRFNLRNAFVVSFQYVFIAVFIHLNTVLSQFSSICFRYVEIIFFSHERSTCPSTMLAFHFRSSAPPWSQPYTAQHVLVKWKLSLENQFMNETLISGNYFLISYKQPFENSINFIFVIQYLGGWRQLSIIGSLHHPIVLCQGCK